MSILTNMCITYIISIYYSDRGDNMDENIDKKFSDFLDSEKADKIYDKFQTSLKQAFIEGYKAGQKITVQIVYIKIKK